MECGYRWTNVRNTIIGPLKVNKPGKTFLLFNLTSEILEMTKYSTIVQLFENAMILLWPDGIKQKIYFAFCI